MREDGPRLSRRALLRGGGLLGLAVFVPVGRAGPDGSGVAIAVEAGAPGFLADADCAPTGTGSGG